jgi:hypothetical protein
MLLMTTRKLFLVPPQPRRDDEPGDSSITFNIGFGRITGQAFSCDSFSCKGWPPCQVFGGQVRVETVGLTSE